MNKLVECRLSSNSIETAIRDLCAKNGAGAYVFFLDIIADEMRNTAMHVRENWQDETTAKTWDSIANRVEKASVLANR